MRTAYKFCLKCAAPFKKIESHLECTSCGFELYDNPRLTLNVIIANEAGEGMQTDADHLIRMLDEFWARHF